MEKYVRARQATDDNTRYSIVNEHCMLDNQGYRHTLRIRNTYCFSTATMVTRTQLHITFIRTLPVLFKICRDFGEN